MKLFEFIKNNDRCPICDNPLTLCLQLIDETLFIGSQNKEYFTFVPFRNVKNKRQDDTISLSLDDNNINLSMSSNHVLEIFNKSQFFFFYVCNINGFNADDTKDCSISSYHCCYYTGAPIMYIAKEVTPEDQVIWKFKTVSELTKDLVSVSDQYCFRKITEELEKVYIVSLDYEDKKTSFWHYSFTPEQAKDENYEPPLFEKFLPLVPNGLNTDPENRDNLFSKFNSWVIMS